MQYQPYTKEMIANPAPVGLDSGNAIVGNAMTTADNTTAHPEVIESRFGAVTVDPARAILFPVGLLGMPDKHHFVLTEFPNEKLGQFRLLQSLEESDLSFITLPLPLDNDILARSDIEAVSRDMEIPLEDMGIVLIVSVHRSPAEVQLSVNARAPIFFDTKQRAAAQYVFTSNKYPVQYFITGNKPEQASGAS